MRRPYLHRPARASRVGVSPINPSWVELLLDARPDKLGADHPPARHPDPATPGSSHPGPPRTSRYDPAFQPGLPKVTLNSRPSAVITSIRCSLRGRSRKITARPDASRSARPAEPLVAV